MRVWWAGWLISWVGWLPEAISTLSKMRNIHSLWIVLFVLRACGMAWDEWADMLIRRVMKIQDVMNVSE